MFSWIPRITCFSSETKMLLAIKWEAEKLRVEWSRKAVRPELGEQCSSTRD